MAFHSEAIAGRPLPMPLDWAFYEQFDPESAVEQKPLRSLVELERQAIECGEIVSENVVIIARKR